MYINDFNTPSNIGQITVDKWCYLVNDPTFVNVMSMLGPLTKSGNMSFESGQHVLDVENIIGIDRSKPL